MDISAGMEEVLELCFRQGRSQTILLLGLNSLSTCEQLRNKVRTDFPQVLELAVTGSLFPEEPPAIELLTRQLFLCLNQPYNPSDSLSTFKEVLHPGHNLLFTVLEAEHYAHKGQQRLLYTLLEIVTEAPCGLLLILQSTRLDFTELLEKRLKSRLNAKPFCCMQREIEGFKREVMEKCGELMRSEEWENCFNAFLSSTDFEHYYAIGKPIGWILYLFRRAIIENIHYNNPIHSLEVVQKEEATGLTASFLRELPQYEMAVLIAHAQTELDKGFSNFDLAFAWLKSKARNGVVNHSRRSFFRVSSRMIALGLVEKQSRYLSDELSVLHLQIEAKELFGMIMSGEVRGLTLFGAWIRSS
jgi:hypothetical protein